MIDVRKLKEEQLKLAKKVVLKDGLIQGMVLTNEIEKVGIIYNLMKDKVNVENFKETLVDSEFSLVSLPESLWREKVPALSTDGQRLVAEAESQEEVAISR